MPWGAVGPWFEWSLTKEEMQDFMRYAEGLVGNVTRGWMYEITDIRPSDGEIYNGEKREQ